MVRENIARKAQIQQLNREIDGLKTQLQKNNSQAVLKCLETVSFLDAAINSANNLQSLVFKESYRNKIASLNNPTSNELGFSLELEVRNSLQPLLMKAKKVNSGKFQDVVSRLMQTGSSSVYSLFPAGSVFTSVLSLVSNLTVQEKNIDQEDLELFIRNVEKYFSQYEKLYQSNVSFNLDMEKMKMKLKTLQSDIRLLTEDMVIAVDRKITRKQLQKLTTEELILQYLSEDKVRKSSGSPVFPPDAIKSCKEIANSIKRTYEEYGFIYETNYREIKGIINDAKTLTKLDLTQVTKTLKDIDHLYNESRNVDASNLRLKTLFERLEVVIR